MRQSGKKRAFTGLYRMAWANSPVLVCDSLNTDPPQAAFCGSLIQASTRDSARTVSIPLAGKTSSAGIPATCGNSQGKGTGRIGAEKA